MNTENTQIEKFIKKLVAGSIVVVANDKGKYEEYKKINSKIDYFYITNNDTAPVNNIMKSKYGKVMLKRPKFHMQFDVIYCGGNTTTSLFKQLSEYWHPGGIAYFNGKLNTHLPDHPSAITYAKLREGG